MHYIASRTHLLSHVLIVLTTNLYCILYAFMKFTRLCMFGIAMFITLTCLRFILPCACTLYIVILLHPTKQGFITWSRFQCLLFIFTFTSFNINNVRVAWNSYRGGKPSRRKPNQISAKFVVFIFSEIPFGKV